MPAISLRLRCQWSWDVNTATAYLRRMAGDDRRQYAQRGQFDPRSLDSLLEWLNARRTTKGLPMIGIPDQADRESLELLAPNLPDSGYNPLTGEFEDAP